QVRAPGPEVLNAADPDAGLVHVDPVVGKRIGAVEHQGDADEVAIAQARGGVDNGGGWAGLGDGGKGAQGEGGDDVARCSLLVARPDHDRVVRLEAEAGDR